MNLKHYAKRKKPDLKGYVQQLHNYIHFLEFIALYTPKQDEFNSM